MERKDPENHYWVSPYAPDNSTSTDVVLVTIYPKTDDIKLHQEIYSEDFIKLRLPYY